MWKIIIVEDNARVIQGLKRVIPWEKLRAEYAGEARNGQQGLQLARQTRPDIIITDIYMPVMDGLTMIKQLREERFDGKLIILSGYSDFEYARQALRLDIEDYLSKPVTVQTITEVLERVIDRLVQERGQQMQDMQKNDKIALYETMYEKDWIRKVITGEYESRHEEMIPIAGTDWESGQYVVLGLAVSDSQKKRHLQLFDFNLLRYAVKNVVSETVGQLCPRFECVELHTHHLAVLILVPERLQEAQPALRELGEKIVSHVHRYLQLNIKIGIGKVKQDWRTIKESTWEAFHALLHNGPRPTGHHVIDFGQLTEGDKSLTEKRFKKFAEDAAFYRQLSEAVKYAQREQANSVIAEYLQGLSTVERTDAAYLHLVGIEIWTIIEYSLYDMGFKMDEIFAEMDLLQEMKPIVSLEQLLRWFHAKVELICSSQQWNENSRHKQIVDAMLTYIHNHYMENVTLPQLSERLFISRNHLGQLFIKVTGESFKNYLTRIRMEKARELILDGNHLVYEVAYQVGYTNVAYFTTLFKKHTGMKPTDLYKRELG